MTAITMTKDELLAALEARRPWAEASDRRRSAEHAKAEKEALKAFRARLREALTWDYETAAGPVTPRGWRRPTPKISLDDPPSCPLLTVPRLDEAITVVRMSNQKRYTIDRKGRHAELYDLLTRDDDAVTTPC